MNQKQPSKSIRKWDVFEVRYKAAEQAQRVSNPFVDVRFAAEFSCGVSRVRVDGFYDGDGEWVVRFMPDREGVWRFRTASNVRALDKQEGTFRCCTPSSTAHGPVRVAHKHHFAYADGTPFLPNGTTAYGWMNQPMSRAKQTLATLRRNGFNKIRACVFPKEYDFNHDDPPMFAFERDAKGAFDFMRPNPEFFRHIEWCIGQLAGLGTECDLILFHPYDRWGFSAMSPQADDRYLTYIVSRLGAMRNVWWSLANEFDIMRAKCDNDFCRFLEVISKHDPYGHLRSNHNCMRHFDHGHRLITHVSLQWQQDDYGEVKRLRDQYGKPVCVDESGYEGDIHHGWGNLPATEELHRALMTVILGGHAAGHGETYWNAREVLWWGKGGVLTGQSPARLVFLRQTLEHAPWPLEPAPDLSHWDRWAIADPSRRFALVYFGRKQPAYTMMTLPKGRRYRADVLDMWTMKAVAVKGTFAGECRIPLAGRCGAMLRLKAV